MMNSQTAVLDSEDLPTNLSDNPEFQTVVDSAVSRRGFLRSGTGLTAAMFLGLGGGLAGCATSGGRTSQPLLGFKPIAISTADTVQVAPGYSAKVLAPWGTPLVDGAANFKGDGSEDAAAQALQVGDNHDGIHFFALDGKSHEGLLVMNHEYCTVNEKTGAYTWLFGRKGADAQKKWSKDHVHKSMNAHGVSVIHIQKNAKGQWDIVKGSVYNRRITAFSAMEMTGPAAGDALLQTKGDPSGRRAQGTFNNCGNGFTPWGTYLACEENFNNYFGTSAGEDRRNAAQKRYGISAKASLFQWEKHEARFDYVQEPHEANRFGWIVEIDPFNPGSIPQKRTALGRFKHENAAFALTKDGRPVVYMGDDQANDYIYKFVSKHPYVPGGKTSHLLDEGDLYVARFDAGKASGDFAGTGQWLLLDKQRNGKLQADAQFANQAAVLVHARMAGDVVGATKMDRPEWVTVHPRTGEVYVTLTNNTSRTVADAANPRPRNVYGQIVRWREAGGDAAATQFEWDVFVLAGNPAVHTDRKNLMSGSANITADNTFNSPDGLAFDAEGRLWIQTDGKYSNQGDYAGQGNNQMLCADPVTKEIRRFLVGPKECEVTGITFTPDHTTMFINIQHPGEEGDSHWPDGGTSIPRSATVVITKDGGGVIGS
ncbi:PhoX family protein [Comamonas jiangduensis]|uniref:PhoX family protein n=2 Tax=Comamonas jiangduensis TaxID=1194168 RepID=UPI003BF91924